MVVETNPRFAGVSDSFIYRNSGDKYSPVSLFAGGKRLILRPTKKPKHFTDYVISSIGKYFTCPKKVMDAILEEVKSVEDGNKAAIKAVCEVQYWLKKYQDEVKGENAD